MDLRKLQIFTAVAELQSFSLASERLFMAQPAVSIAVKKLEDEFSVQLLQRKGRKIALTTEGETAYKLAKQLLSQAEELKETMSGYQNLIKGEVKIACPSMVATYYLPNILTPFLQKYTGLNANVFQTGTRRIEQMIESSEIEVGVITTDSPSAALASVPLLKEHVVLCTHHSNPLAKKKVITSKDVEAEPMVVYETDYFIRAKLDEFCRTAQVKPEFRIESNFLPLLINSVKQQLGSTIGLSMVVNTESELIGIPFSPAMSVNLAVAWNPNHTLSKANQCFVDWLLKTNSD